MKLSGRRGKLRLHLDRPERLLLATLFDDLDDLLAGDAGDAGDNDPVLERLYPAAYRDDDEAETEFSTLTRSGLHAERVARIEACRAELASDAAVDLTGPEVATRWITVLNDLRLAVGTRLGVTEEDVPDIDPTDPTDQPRVVYYWLTAVQDSIVTHLMG